jgi:hypothetical protein
VLVIITKSEPFTKKEIKAVREQFDTYIKTVIDVKRKICSAGADRHFESEAILMEQGSKQADVWGGGIYLATRDVDYNSFINIRASDNNTSNEIQDAKTRKLYEEITRFFFKEIYEQ